MPHRRPAYRLTALIATLLMSGCGMSSATVAEVPCPTPTVAATPTPAPKASAKSQPKAAKTAPKAVKPSPHATAKPTVKASTSPQAKPAPTDDAKALATAMQQAMAALTSYDAVVTAVDVRQDGKASTKTTTQIRYQAPGSYRMDVQTSTMAMAAGSKTLLTIGSPNVQVKAGGILGIATLTLPLTDDRVASLNHWTPDHLYAHTVVDRAMAGNGTWVIAGTATVAGTAVTMLTYTTPANALDPRIATERFGLDADHHVRFWAAYGGPETQAADGMLYQFTVESLTVNPTLAGSLFHF